MTMAQRHDPVAHGDWGRGFAAPPDLCSAATGWRGGLLRRWRSTAAAMEQPRLDQHYAVLHLDGAKRITRRGNGPDVVVEAKPAASSLVRAGSSHSWSTEGPIGFAHLYIDPLSVGRIVRERFDRDARSVELADCVGVDAPLLAALFLAMMAEVEAPGPAPRLVLDTLLQSFLVQLVCRHSSLGEETRTTALRPISYGIAPRRLRRVLDFVEANLADDLALDDLASVAGSSRFHFSRAFRDATGFPPYRYLVQRRIEVAKNLLLEDELTTEAIAAQCGFKSAGQFAVMFKQVFGTTPARFRREH